MGGKTIASTTRAWRVLKTNHPPTYYLPGDAFFAERVLRETSGSPWCEWKGRASDYDVVIEQRVAPKAAWSYVTPSPGFEPIAGAVAVMPRWLTAAPSTASRSFRSPAASTAAA